MTDSQSDVSSTQDFPITLVTMKSITDKELYDIDGNLVLDKFGNVLNIYKEEMKDAIESGDIRVVHNIGYGFRYIVKRTEQEERFIDERKNGSFSSDKHYYIYPDEDMIRPPWDVKYRSQANLSRFRAEGRRHPERNAQ